MTNSAIPAEVLAALEKISADQPDAAHDEELISLLLENLDIENPRYKVGGYLRISDFRDEDGDSDIGVVRQAKDILEFCTRKKVQVVEWFVDNDISASNKHKKRPDHIRLFSKVTAGTLAGMVAWDFERLYRQPREVEDLIDLAQERDIYVATEQEDLDLSTGAGKDRARDLVRGAAKYSDEISRRQKRKVKSRAAKGLWHGGIIPFGYQQAFDDDGERKKGYLVANPGETLIVLRAAELVLAGEPLSKVTRILEEEGRLNRNGKPWRRTSLRAMLLRPALAGIRRHEPRIMHTNKPDPRNAAKEVGATWDPIISLEDHAALCALLLVEQRRTTPLGGGHARKFLGVGYIACGRCGGKVIGKTGRSGTYTYRYYICEKCYVRRDAGKVDEFLAGSVVESLSRLGAINATTDSAPLLLELEDIASREDALAETWAEGKLTDRSWEAARRKLDVLRVGIERQLELLSVPQAPKPQDPAVLRREWEKGDLEDRRKMLAQAGLVFRLDPVGRGSHSVGLTALPAQDDTA